MKIAIIAVPCFPAPATQLRVDDVHVTLGETANCQFALLDAQDHIVGGPARISLTPEQYAAWTGDDSFVCYCVAENLKLTPA